MKENKDKLLPNYFKKIGLVVAILPIILFIILRLTNILLGDNVEYYRDIMMNTILLGMFLIAFSKEKVEDEMIRSIRYKAFASALVFGVAFTLIQAPINLISKQYEYEGLSALQVLNTVMLWEIIVFALMRRGKESI